ncbi:MAG TPA: hypothetical protein VFE85_09035, partial [Woeseiaceae bacterium]|nr:hypothetical protein [Woeseiaceae bacterium]
MHQQHSYRKTILSSAIAAIIAGTSPAIAQDQPAASGSADDAIEEIVVRGVARRFRPEEQTSATGLNMSLIETPQQVSVLTQE